jgi:Ca2+-binding RTX toxin-like protein
MPTHQTLTNDAILATILRPPLRGGNFPNGPTTTWFGSSTIWDAPVLEAGNGNLVVRFNVANVPGVTAIDVEIFGQRTFNPTSGALSGVNITKLEWSAAGSATVLARLTFNDASNNFQPLFFAIDQVASLSGTTFFFNPITSAQAAVDYFDIMFANGDEFFGAGANDSFEGGGGNDGFEGAGGADTLRGGEGNDTFTYRAGHGAVNELADGGAGTDRILAIGAAASGGLLQQGAVDISNITIASLEQLWTNGAELVINAPQLATTAAPGGFNTIVGLNGARDVLTIRGVSNHNLTGLTFQSWEAPDLVGVLGTSGSDTIIGTANSDVFVTGLGQDNLTAGAGDDRFLLQGDKLLVTDTLAGGIGADTLQVTAPFDFTGVDLRGATISSVERLDITAGTVQLRATAFNGTIVSTANPTPVTDAIGTITGIIQQNAPVNARLIIDAAQVAAVDLRNTVFVDWNDGFYIDKELRIVAGAATQVIYGSTTEENWIAALNSPNAMFLFGGSQDDYMVGSNQNDWIGGDGGADYILGLSGADFMGGEAGNDYIEGNAGADSIGGSEGNDTLDGGGDNDLLIGGADADSLTGGDGSDFAAFAGAARVIVNLFTGQGFEGEAAGDTYASIENVSATAFDDIVVGEAAGNAIDGRGGADTLYGNAGNDTLLGGDGADRIFGEADNDLAFGWTGADTLWGGDGNDTLWGEQDNDTLLGETGDDVLLGVEGDDVMYGWFGSDTLYGWTGADVLWGEGGNDSLLGEDGADIFIGGLGRDTMTGGAGADRFFNANFEIAAGEVDLITDFDAADRYLFQTGASIQYFSFNAPGYGVGAGIHVAVAGGVYILDVFGATTAQLQAQTQFF